MGVYDSPVVSELKVCDRRVMSLESCLDHPVEMDVDLLLFVSSLV
jgi:hypothetical protein